MRGGGRGGFRGGRGPQASYPPSGGFRGRGPPPAQPRGAAPPRGPAQHPPHPSQSAPSAPPPPLANFAHVDRSAAEMTSRCPRPVPHPLLSVSALYVKDNIDLRNDVPVKFEVDKEDTIVEPTAAASSATNKTYVRVALLNGRDTSNVKRKENNARCLNFLLLKREGVQLAPVGGELTEKDGKTVTDKSVKNCAVRLCQEQLGVDISACKIIRFMEFKYRNAKDEAWTSIVVIPNIWDTHAEGLKIKQLCKQVEEEVTETVKEEKDEEVDGEQQKVTITKTITSKKLIPKPCATVQERSLLDLKSLPASGQDSQFAVFESLAFADAVLEYFSRKSANVLRETFEVKAAEGRKRKREAEEEAARKRQKLEEEKAAAEAKKKEAEEKGETEPEAKKEEEKMDVDEEKKEEKKDEKPAGPPMKRVVDINEPLLAAFQWLEMKGPNGSVRREVLENNLRGLGTMSMAQIQSMLTDAGVGLGKGAVIQYKNKFCSTERMVEMTAEDIAAQEERKRLAAERVEAARQKQAELDKQRKRKDELNGMLAKSLRDLCTEKGLSEEGKKNELVDRILQAELKEAEKEKAAAKEEKEEAKEEPMKVDEESK